MAVCGIGKWVPPKMGFLKIDMEETFSEALRKKLAEAGPKAAHAVAVQIAKDTEPYVPALTKSLANRSQAVENMVIYPGPYARYLYYGKVMVTSSGKGPMHFKDKQGNDVIMFPKGSKLHATNKDLVFTTSVHPLAQSEWFEASKAQNKDKWVEVAEKAVVKYLK